MATVIAKWLTRYLADSIGREEASQSASTSPASSLDDLMARWKSLSFEVGKTDSGGPSTTSTLRTGSSGSGFTRDFLVSTFDQTTAVRLRQALQDDPVTPGVMGPADQILADGIAADPRGAMECLGTLFTEFYSDVFIASSIILLASRLPFSVADPVAVLIAVSALSHKEPLVQESGIRAFEAWDNAKSLSILQSVRVAPKWLQSYLQAVIDDMQSRL